MQNEKLKAIPKMDILLSQSEPMALIHLYGRKTVLKAAREVVQMIRDEIQSGVRLALPSEQTLHQFIKEHVQKASVPSLTRVINATGVLLHTNLGRAPLAKAAVDRVLEVASTYTTLEYDKATGDRGSRHTHVASLLVSLTGAADAMVVNNNAAAVLLMLSSLANGKEVIISRGELVEIGGSFRIPEIMTLSGATLCEVGTTNRTYAEDYINALSEKTGALLKVHTSNYKIIGFTKETSVQELVSIGKANNVPVLYDLGGGLLVKDAKACITDEPCVCDYMNAGVDLLCFSGDKLLGGPQSGILLGTKEAIAKCKRHPLARALRVDKMTLAALEGTLMLYRDDALALREIPILKMATAPIDTLQKRATKLMDRLDAIRDQVTIIKTESQIGGGTTPALVLPSVAVAITPRQCSAVALEKTLRSYSVPIVARIAQDLVILDMRTVQDTELTVIADCLLAAISPIQKLADEEETK